MALDDEINAVLNPSMCKTYPNAPRMSLEREHIQSKTAQVRKIEFKTPI